MRQGARSGQDYGGGVHDCAALHWMNLRKVALPALKLTQQNLEVFRESLGRVEPSVRHLKTRGGALQAL